MAGGCRFGDDICAAGVAESWPTHLGLYLAALGHDRANGAVSVEAAPYASGNAPRVSNSWRAGWIALCGGCTSGDGIACPARKRQVCFDWRGHCDGAGAAGLRNYCFDRAQAVESFNLRLHAFCKSLLGLNPPNDVHARILPFSESRKTFGAGLPFKPARPVQISTGLQTQVPQLTQSRNLYHIPANGRNHGLPLYNLSGAPGNGIPAKGLSGLSPAINSAIFWPW